LGQTALSEQTWEKGLGHGFEMLLENTMRGILSGAATSVVSQAFEAIPVGRAAGPALKRTTIGSLADNTGNPFLRGGIRALSGSLGAFSGREVELGLDRRHKGDAGDIFVAGLEAAGQSAAQDFAGGTFEGFHQNRVNQREAAARPTTRAAAQPTAETPGAPTRTTPQVETEPPGAPTRTTPPAEPEMHGAPAKPTPHAAPEIVSPTVRPATPAEAGPHATTGAPRPTTEAPPPALPARTAPAGEVETTPPARAPPACRKAKPASPISMR
jgi:hypothetical protein